MGRYSDFRASLDGARFDVVVIGGGVNGVAIARECARGGRRTLLLEQSDFASGTTSRATRIIHGGLRYLEYGELDLVRESLRERASLASEHPNQVHPLEFLLPIGPGSRRSPLEVRLGLWMYRRFGGRFGARRSKSSAIDSLLGAQGRWTVFSYEDAQCEFPERLVADWLLQACAAGLEARNHTQALDVRFASGVVRGLRLRDLLTGAEATVEAPWIVNAGGPWVDHVCHAAGLTGARTLIGGVRGTHVVLPRFPGAPPSAVYGEAHDGRPIFLVPWNDQILLGTTEVPDGGDPGRVQPSEREIEYLFAWLRRFFPGAKVSRDDMCYAYAGVRPLPFAPGRPPAEVTRRHIIHDHAGEGARGMLSIVGGKLTTAASLAREVARKLGLRVAEPRGLAYLPDLAEATLQEWAKETAGASRLSLDTVKAIVNWHGPAASTIARLAAGSERLAQPLCDGTLHTVAEAAHALRHERAVRLADVLLRRVPVALAGWWSREATRQAATRIGAALGWGEAEIYAETELFEIERAQMLFTDFLPAPLRRPA